LNKIVIASRNAGKVKEIKQLLEGMNLQILSATDFPQVPQFKETGNSYRENALIKAKAVYDYVKLPVIADDSGIEVNALNLAPGVYSAIYAGEDADDIKNRNKLIDEINKSADSDRSAKFVCVLVYFDGKTAVFFEGECIGKVITEERGNAGFGYDPLFIPEGYDKTFAELEQSVKNRISHRAKAVSGLIDYLKKHCR
jgi:XTP/dITP diphosphohydrolase